MSRFIRRKEKQNLAEGVNTQTIKIYHGGRLYDHGLWCTVVVPTAEVKVRSRELKKEYRQTIGKHPMIEVS